MTKKVLVYDVAAENSGALSILNQFYNKAINDKTNKYIFVVSIIQLSETNNVKVITLPWVKKSWVHRLFCDMFYVQKIIRDTKITRIISLQNIGIRHNDIYESVYVHNALPFSEYRFSFSEDIYLWIYQNIIGWIMKASLRKADQIIVQTNWMRNKILIEIGINEDKVKIDPITLKVDGDKSRISTDKLVFFYPAQPFKFKNHQIIIDACRILKRYDKKYEVIFTIEEGDRNSITIIEQINSLMLPIKCVGYLEKKEMIEYYRKATLLFPSYIETIGLPLLEAKLYHCNIIVADCEYAREALHGYDMVSYFKNQDSHSLAQLMKKEIDEKA